MRINHLSRRARPVFREWAAENIVLDLGNSERYAQIPINRDFVGTSRYSFDKARISEETQD